MQYRLSTIFLVFFVAATSLAAFGGWGMWIAFVLCIAALSFNKAQTKQEGAVYVVMIVCTALVCTGLLLPAYSVAREAPRRTICRNNLKQIGLGLLNYENARHHFPAIIKRDKDGKPLFSWMVEILPNMEYDSIYSELNKDESWDSEHNGKILKEIQISEFLCPSNISTEKDCSSNYVAIIGPGTIWRTEGTVSLKALRNSPQYTVAAVECVVSDKHWAEPYVLTVEEVLERMKTGAGMRISSTHAGVVSVLFADGHVAAIDVRMPIPVWRKLLMGEIKSFDEIESWPDHEDEPFPFNMLINKSPLDPNKLAKDLSIVVWLISVAMLFYRAWASRARPPVKEVLKAHGMSNNS